MTSRHRHLTLEGLFQRILDISFKSSIKAVPAKLSLGANLNLVCQDSMVYCINMRNLFGSKSDSTQAVMHATVRAAKLWSRRLPVETKKRPHLLPRWENAIYWFQELLYLACICNANVVSARLLCRNLQSKGPGQCSGCLAP